MSVGRIGCKYCGRTNCYGECVNQPDKFYHSACPHCGSNSCGLEKCRYQANWEAMKLAASKPPAPLPQGELIGHRVWRIATVRTADPDLVEVGKQLAIPYAIVLQSMNGTLWPGPVMHADEKPRRYNSNGIYVLRSDKRKYDDNAPVSGTIALYGHVAEHEDGYRAEHAMIRSLTLHVKNLTEHLSYPETPEQKNTVGKQIAGLAQVLERRYECEVLIDAAGPSKDVNQFEYFMSRVASGTITAAELAEIAKIFGK